MVRKRDVIKHELRAYFGLKSIRGWAQHGGWKHRGLSTKQIWDKLQEVFDDYMFDVSETEEDDILAELRQMLFMSVPLVAGALYGFELFGNGTKRHVPPQKTKAEAVKALQRELRNLTLNYLEWGINDVAIRVIKPDVSVGKGGRSFI